jgi:hypothetical protein
LNPTDYYREAVAPKLGAVANFVRYTVDRERRSVRASLAGAGHSRAAYQDGFGCRVIHPGVGAAFGRESDTLFPAESLEIAGRDAVNPTNAAIAEATDHAFFEPASGPHRYTKAIVILQHGRVVGERYAPGITPATPLQGWSMTKSVTNALIGILVREGELNVAEPAPIEEWSSPSDARHAITTDQLLRMVSGVRCGQSLEEAGFWTIFDSDTQMLYDAPDQAAFAANAALRAAPGNEWQYTNCNFALLSRIIRNAAGGNGDAARGFVERELFAPLGMRDSTLEFDSAGTPLGTVQLWASARDWARFGLLYLRDGVTPSGQRILPPGWVDYSARLTPQSDSYGYGAGFWTQRGNSAGGRERIASGMPPDSFMAFGSQGQFTIIVPSADLVIVRLGWSYTPDNDIGPAARLTREVVAALRTEQIYPVNAHSVRGRGSH